MENTQNHLSSLYPLHLFKLKPWMLISSFSLTSKDEQNLSCLFQLEWDVAGPSALPRSYSTSAASFFGRSGNCWRSKEKWDQSASHLMQSLTGIKLLILHLFVILPIKNISPVQFFSTTSLEEFVTALPIRQKSAASQNFLLGFCSFLPNLPYVEFCEIILKATNVETEQ